MKICLANYQNYGFNKGRHNLSFGRALSEKELEEYTKTLNDAREIIGIKKTSLILPDFYSPGRTLTSKESFNFIKLMQKMTGANIVQTLPRNHVTEHNPSPYSGSSFEVGENLIYNIPNLEASYKNLSTNHLLRQEFEDFIKENPHLERYGMIDALKKEYGTDYWSHWQGANAELDKNLFNYDDSEKIPDEILTRQREIIEKHQEKIKFYQYKQFVGNKQHLELKQSLNNEGIKLYGDCLIGFNHKDQWAFKHAFFRKGRPLANSEWKNPCLDFEKLYEGDPKEKKLGAAGKVIKKKFDFFLSNYDGIRMDAAHHLSHPVVNGEKLELGQKLIDILRMSVKDQNAKREAKHQILKEDILFELLGIEAEKEKHLTKDEFSHICITRYANNRDGTNKKYSKTYKPSTYTLGIGSHDDESLIRIAQGYIPYTGPLDENLKKVQAELLKEHLNTSVETPEEFRNAKFAEIFTAINQFFTASDAIGDERRLNNSENQRESWRININDLGKNPEETYFKNLSEGKGLNTPISMAIAIKAKLGENEKTKAILSSLDKFGKILKEKEGPFTIAEATKLFDNTNKGKNSRVAIAATAVLALAGFAGYLFSQTGILRAKKLSHINIPAASPTKTDYQQTETFKKFSLNS